MMLASFALAAPGTASSPFFWADGGFLLFFILIEKRSFLRLSCSFFSLTPLTFNESKS